MPVARRLAEKYRVFALDFRGHGASSKPAPPEAYQWSHFVDDTTEVCRQILIECDQQRFELAAGSSLGGIIAAALASMQQALFQRIVMLDPPVWPSEAVLRKMGEDPRPARTGQSDIAVQARKRRSVWPSRSIVAQAYRKKPMFAQWDESAFQGYLEEGFQDREDGQVALSCPPEVEASIFELTGSIDIFERAGFVTAPVNLVRAANGYFPIKLYEHLARCFPHCELGELAGGHLLPVEVPLITAELLLSAD